VLSDSPVNSNQQVTPRLLWWRFVALSGLLFVAAYAFCWDYEPMPTRAQQLVFDSILVAMLVQLAQAGWFRGNDPWEIRFLEFLLFAFLIVGAVAVVLALIFILVPAIVDRADPGLVVILVIVFAIIGLVGFAFLFDRDHR